MSAILNAEPRRLSELVPDLLPGLEDRFRLLSGGRRAVMPRQQTLRGTVEWSVDLLDDVGRIVLRRMSVFAGGSTLDAAQAVCAGDGIADVDVLEHLSRLIDKSLVTTTDGQEGQRYVQLQTLREYGAELLVAAGEEEVVRSRHAAYFAALAQRAVPHLTGADQATWFGRLEEEGGNLHQAIQWLSRNDPQQALKLAADLWRFWFVRGYLSEGRDLLKTALAVAPESDADGGVIRARALHGVGVLANDQGDYEAARQALAASLEIRRQLEDRPGMAQVLHALGIAARDQGDYTTARRLLEESLAFHREIDDPAGIAMAMHALGIIAHREGNCDAAWSLFEEGLEIRRRLHDRRGIAAFLAHLGAVAYDQERFAEARRLLQEALGMFRELGSKRGILWTLMHLGGVSQQRGERNQALTQHRESLRLCAELGDRHHMARALEWIAGMKATGNHPERALRFLGAAAAIRTAIGSPLTPIERQAVEANEHRARGFFDATRAQQLLDEGARMERHEAVRAALGSSG